MPSALTDIERKILDYMVVYLRTNTYQPSIREIGEKFSIKSTKTVSEHLQSLADKGYLERDPSRSRGVRILGMDLNAQTVSIPCYRRIPDDRDGLMSDQVEGYFSLDRRLAGSKGSFFVRARGTEMAGLGLVEGDYLLVEPAFADEIADGDVVAVRLEHHAAFFRYAQNGSGGVLRPGKPSEPVMPVEDPSLLDVVGKVTALYRRIEGHPTAVSSTAH